jgi:hypothetical protein
LYSGRSRGRQPTGRYLLTGIAKCCCGYGLSGRKASQRENEYQYWCKRCRKIYIKTTHLDDWAWDFTVRTLRDQSQTEAIEREARELAERREALITEAAAIEQTLIEVAARLGRQELSLQRHVAIARPLEQRQATIRRELSELAETEPAPLPEGIPAEDWAHIDWLWRWDSGTYAEKRAMLLRPLNGRKLTVGPGRDARFDPSRVSVS